MKNTILSCLCILLSQTPALASDAPTWKEKCSDLRACIENVSALTGDQYIYDNDIRGSTQFTAHLPFEKEGADLYFTNALYRNGLARVPVRPHVYEILRVNDAKGKALPLVTCDQKTEPPLPDTYDLVTMEYKFTHKGVAKDAENVTRTYAEMGARIYGIEVSDKILVTEYSKNLKKIYRLLTSLDVQPTPEYLARKRAREAARTEAGSKP